MEDSEGDTTIALRLEVDETTSGSCPMADFGSVKAVLDLRVLPLFRKI
jgi:hypothetical protein